MGKRLEIFRKALYGKSMITTYKIPDRKLEWIRFLIGLPKAQFIKAHAKYRLILEKSSLEMGSKILYVVSIIPKSEKSSQIMEMGKSGI